MGWGQIMGAPSPPHLPIQGKKNLHRAGQGWMKGGDMLPSLIT